MNKNQIDIRSFLDLFKIIKIASVLIIWANASRSPPQKKNMSAIYV